MQRSAMLSTSQTSHSRPLDRCFTPVFVPSLNLRAMELLLYLYKQFHSLSKNYTVFTSQLENLSTKMALQWAHQVFKRRCSALKTAGFDPVS
jgi:hypothetical protein